MISKNKVGLSSTGLVNICSKYPSSSLSTRIPSSFNKVQFDNAWLWFTRWVHQLVETKPNILQHLIPRQYKHGDFIVVRGIIYNIDILTHSLKISKASLDLLD